MVWNRQPQPSTAIQAGRPKIMIGVPYEVKITMFWGMRMLAPLLYAPLAWADKAHSMVRGVPLPVARDQIVEAALADPAVTHIMWVDTDNICVTPPNPNDALKMLYDCNQPIVSGLYRAKQREGFNYAMWMDAKLDKPGFLPIQSYTGNWLQVDVVGHGFCLVQRVVYETLKKPWYPWPTPAPSEDFNFCISARKHGFAVNVFTEVQLRHLGELSVNPDGSTSVLEV